MENEKILLPVFTALESAHFFSAFNPSVFTIQAHVQSAADVRAIRKGELLASISALALAGVVAGMTGTYLPVWFTIAVVLAMVAVYEHALMLSGAAR